MEFDYSLTTTYVRYCSNQTFAKGKTCPSMIDPCHGVAETSTADFNFIRPRFVARASTMYSIHGHQI